MNVAAHLWAMAARAPCAIALEVQSTGQRITFGELADLASGIARGLEAHGIGRGDRVLLMVKPGVDFAALAFALLGMGAVVVFIDPGMARAHLVDCIAHARPRAIIAERLLHALCALRPRALVSVKTRISVGWWPGACSISRIRRYPSSGFEPAVLSPVDDAVVAFTSGATGKPKGVLLQHSVLAEQLESFKRLGSIGEGDVYLAILPVLAIFGPGFGCTTVFPDIDASKPRTINPLTLVAAVERYRVTHSFGSPAVWRAVAKTCIRMPSMRCLLIGGAPVAPSLLAALAQSFPHATLHTPYGATEAVPLISATASEILGETQANSGTLIGHPLPGVEVRIVAISDGRLNEAAALPTGAVGEIAVRAAVVSRGYERLDEADALAKIPDPAGPWHRMGDVGYVDVKGRIWFCGRKSERVSIAGIPLFTACVEPRFEAHRAVRRAALIGVGNRAVVVVELRNGRKGDARSAAEILDLRGELPIDRVMFKRRLPLDTRHAVKILRSELVLWASARLT